MYIATIPNRSSPPAILLRESYREGPKVKTRTLANLTHWPAEKIEGMRRVLADESMARPAEKIEGMRRVLADESMAPITGSGADGSGGFEIQRTLPHGHVAAVLGTLRRVGLDRIVDSKKSKQRELTIAMIAARVIDPRSKLATAHGLGLGDGVHQPGRSVGSGVGDRRRSVRGDGLAAAPTGSD